MFLIECASLHEVGREIQASTVTAPETPDNLCSLMLSDKLRSVQDVQDYVTKNRKVFDMDQRGGHALMVACALSKKEVTKFLLGEGVNPNKPCNKLSTPLHYACRPKYNQGDGLAQLPIIEMLVKHGAKFTPDIHGWTPICYAAMHKMGEIVEYFLNNSKEALPISDRILAVEILAFARSVFDDDDSQAYGAILRAMKLREEYGTHITPSTDSAELGACIRTHECKTTSELQALGTEKEAHKYCKQQGLLIGMRVLPDAIKDRFLWPLLASIHNHDTTESHLRTCRLILRFESQSRVAIGTALEGMADLIEPFRLFLERPNPTRLMPNDYSLYHSNLESYREVLGKLSLSNAQNKAPRIHRTLTRVLAGVISELPGDELCPAIIHTVADLVGLLYKGTGNKLLLPSMMQALGYLYDGLTGDGYRLSYHANPNCKIDTQNVMNMMHLAYVLLVKYEFPALSRPIDNSGGTILEALIIDCVNNEELMAVLLPVTKTFIRYDSLIRKTLLNEALKHQDWCYADVQKSYDEFIEVLRESLESVPPLQELAARVVLQNRIPYRGIVPNPIIGIIERDVIAINYQIKPKPAS